MSAGVPADAELQAYTLAVATLSKDAALGDRDSQAELARTSLNLATAQDGGAMLIVAREHARRAAQHDQRADIMHFAGVLLISASDAYRHGFVAASEAFEAEALQVLSALIARGDDEAAAVTQTWQAHRQSEIAARQEQEDACAAIAPEAWIQVHLDQLAALPFAAAAMGDPAATLEIADKLLNCTLDHGLIEPVRMALAFAAQIVARLSVCHGGAPAERVLGVSLHAYASHLRHFDVMIACTVYAEGLARLQRAFEGGDEAAAAAIDNFASGDPDFRNKVLAMAALMDKRL